MSDIARVGIVGSRDIDVDEVRRRVFALVARMPDCSMVVTGGARGVDTEAARAARFYRRGLLIFPADWTKGRSAGFVRNKLIIASSDIVVAFWNYKSSGTSHTIDLACAADKPCYVQQITYVPPPARRTKP